MLRQCSGSKILGYTSRACSCCKPEGTAQREGTAHREGAVQIDVLFEKMVRGMRGYIQRDIAAQEGAVQREGTVQREGFVQIFKARVLLRAICHVKYMCSSGSD